MKRHEQKHYDRAPRAHPPERSIEQLTTDGKHIKTFVNVEAVVKSTKSHRNAILSACTNETSHKNWLWRFADLDDLPDEKWLEYKSYRSSEIWISNMGRVKFTQDGSRFLGDRIFGGYRVIEDKGTTLFVHLMIGQLFLQKTDGTYLKHINGDKINNCVANLKFETCATPIPAKTPAMMRKRRVRQLTMDGVILDEYATVGTAEANIPGLFIGTALSEPSKHAGGFRWEYID